MARQTRATTKQAPAHRGPVEPKYYTPGELATVLNQSERTIRHWRNQGYGPRATKMGRSVRYAITEVDKFRADPEAYQDERDREIA
jgi:predicted DNA-binding transcriptional regulator AlpA